MAFLLPIFKGLEIDGYYGRELDILWGIQRQHVRNEPMKFHTELCIFNPADSPSWHNSDEDRVPGSNVIEAVQLFGSRKKNLIDNNDITAYINRKNITPQDLINSFDNYNFGMELENGQTNSWNKLKTNRKHIEYNYHNVVIRAGSSTMKNRNRNSLLFKNSKTRSNKSNSKINFKNNINNNEKIEPYLEIKQLYEENIPLFEKSKSRSNKSNSKTNLKNNINNNEKIEPYLEEKQHDAEFRKLVNSFSSNRYMKELYNYTIDELKNIIVDECDYNISKNNNNNNKKIKIRSV
jgi:hypothetical protein